MKNNIRKLTKNGRNSYYINIPIDIIRKLKWRERQKLTVTLSRGKIVVADWEK